MSKHLTLFGKVDKSHSNNACVYVQPSNDYEKFVERYYQRNKSQPRPRGDILKTAQSDWKNIYAKDQALLSQYLEPREGEKSVIKQKDDEDPVLMDFGFKNVTLASVMMKSLK